MEKTFCTLIRLENKLKMSKFKPVYRPKSGNCNKPLRYFRDQRFRDEDSGYSRAYASTSQDVNPHHAENTEERMARFRWNYPNQDALPFFNRHSYNNNHRTYRGTAGHERSMHSRAREVPKEDCRGNIPRQKQKLKCPQHLKGKEIGLWYKKQQSKKESVIEIYVDCEAEDFMERYLSKTAAYFSNGEEELCHLTESDDFATFEDKINAKPVYEREQNRKVDNTLYEEYMEKIKQPAFIQMAKYRECLPSFKMKDNIVELINNNQIVVISGGTGCGKTTQVVQYVLDDFILKKKGSMCSIVCTQPRRISAISVADRVAAERNEMTGLSIGYQIRLESKLAQRKTGCINFMTTGVLLQMLAGEPCFQHITHLFLDEVHERTIECDLVMALLKYIIPKRPDLKIILMSATVNARTFSTYFDGAPCIEIPGFTYPVEEIFLEDILKLTKYSFPEMKKPNLEPSFKDYVLPYVRDIEARHLYPKYVTKELANPLSEALDISLIANVVHYICENEEDGAILVFLPGLADIINVNKELTKSPWFSHEKYIVIPMHSLLPSVEQKEVFKTPPQGKRKIIVSTSILETSVTVNDVRFVVDCGKNKSWAFDLKLKVATLEPAWISLANAKQRRGRAGRTKSGKCYKLYSKVRQDLFEQFPTPEFQTTSLEQVILKAKMLKLGHVAPFLEKVMDQPDPEMVDLSLKVLRNLNALDDEERLTPLGRHLSMLPMDPHTGKMILMAALFSCIDPVFSIAACLSFKNPFSVPLDQEELVHGIKEQFARGEKSDHFIYSEVLRQWEEQHPVSRYNFASRNFLSNPTLNLLSEMKKQFADILYSMNFLPSADVKHPESNVNSNNRGLIKAIVCAGLYPNVAVLKKQKKVALLKTLDHGTVRFHFKSYCYHLNSFESPFFVYLLKLKSSSIFIHDATMISPLPLLLFGQGLKITEEDNFYYVIVDDLIKFRISEKTGMLIKRLRSRLDWILEAAISNSRGFDWSKVEGKTEILDGIVKLLSSDSVRHKVHLNE